MNINGASQVYGRYSIKDLVDIDKLSQIFARFSLITGFTATLAVYPTQEILIATGWRDVCTKFHRAFPKSLQRCRESNSSLSRQLTELKQVTISRCKNGLIDGATPIFIRGEYLAFIATGQVFFEEPDIERFKRQAALNGYDLERYLEDVRQVPVVSEAQFTEVLAFLSDLAVGVADQGLRNMELGESYAELEEEVASRKSIEQALRQAEEKYRSIFENEVEGIFQSTPDGRYIAANPAMARMFGYASPEELLAHISDIRSQVYVDPERRIAFRTLIERDKFVKDFEYQVFRKDGSTFWISENARVVQDKKGDLLYYEGFMQDVSDRKEAEELSQTLIRHSPIGIYIIQNRKFQLANQCFHDITCYGRDEFSTVAPWELVHPDDRAEVKQRALDMLLHRNPTPYEYRHITKDGKTKWIMETVIPVQWKGRRATLGYFIDITLHKQLEDQFFQAQKMEAIGRLAGGVAHDFNNLLMVIMCYSEMIRGNLWEGDPLAQSAEKILQASKKAIALIRQLLAFSSKQILKPEIFNLNDTVTEISGMLQRVIGEDIDLVTNLDPKLEIVEADPGQIGQVIMNLAVNARDAMPQGGILFIETANVDLHGKNALEHEGLSPGSYVVLTISDNGVGMDGKTLARIFEPFFSTKEPDKGTGLGLSTTYGIIKQTGGQIEVSSQIGKGTIFTIYFPRSEKTVLPAKTMAASLTSLCGQGTILLVEDEPVLRAVISAILRKYGYEVLEASHGIKALQLYKDYKGPIHLLLTDVVMPKMNGGELARRLVKKFPGLKVLFMSGYAEDYVIQPGNLIPETHFLQKPFEPVKLAQKVGEMLNGSPTDHPPAAREIPTPRNIVFPKYP